MSATGRSLRVRTSRRIVLVRLSGIVALRHAYSVLVANFPCLSRSKNESPTDRRCPPDTLIMQVINTSQGGGARHPRIRGCRCIVAPRVEFFAVSAADRTSFRPL